MRARFEGPLAAFVISVAFGAMLLIGGTFSACHAPVTVTTAAGQQAYTADLIVLRVNELENASLQANATGGIDLPTTKVLVKFAVTADTILKTVPSGWQATVQAAWASTKAALPTQTNAAVVAAMSAVDVVLAAL